MYCVTERLLHVDLSTVTVTEEKIPADIYRKYIGGRGLAAKLMLDMVEPGIDPLSEKNVLIFSVGPAAGTGLQGSDRICLAAKSPLTGLLFNCSMGGIFASTFKSAGFDALAIKGKAGSPKYLLLGWNGVEILDAGAIIGKSPREVLTYFSDKYKNFEVCTVGVAGENLVSYAGIFHPRLKGRGGIAGRGGIGAIMASKNLKAIVIEKEVVVANKKTIAVASEDKFKEIRVDVGKKLIQNVKHFTNFGTAAGVKMINDLGAMATRNLDDEVFEKARDICGESLKERFYKKNIACNNCPVACGKLCDIDGKLVKGPEYETLYSMGSMVGVGDLGSIIRASDLCDQYGLDTITMGVSIAFAIECFLQGYLTKDQTGGLELRFGDPDLILELIAKTANLEGIGKLLAKGTRKMAEILGGDTWKYAYQVKGLELAGHSPRALKVMAVGYATGTRGGSHQDTRPRYAPDFKVFDGKEALAVSTQNLSAIGDSLIQCRFLMEASFGPVLSETYTELLEAMMGWKMDVAELNEIGARIWHAERQFNVREGVSRECDSLPYKVTHEKIKSGPLEGEFVPPAKLEEMLDEYYRLRSCDSNGIPQSDALLNTK